MFFQESLNTELLKEFLRAVEGTGAFSTPSQLRDTGLYTQSVRTQWEVGLWMQFSIEFLKCNSVKNTI